MQSISLSNQPHTRRRHTGYKQNNQTSLLVLNTANNTMTKT